MAVSDQPTSQTNLNTQANSNNHKSYEKTIAVWTIILGLSTLALVIATGVSAYFLYMTDITIGKQVDAARMQLRAYIGATQYIAVPQFYKQPTNESNETPKLPMSGINKSNQAPATQASEPKPTFVGEALAIVLKNYGSTPAKDFSVWTSAKWLPEGIEPNFDVPADNISEITIITLNPGAEVSSSAIGVDAGSVTNANNRNGHIYLWGDATYTEVFPNKPLHHFHFCLVAITMPVNAGQAGGWRPYKTSCNYSD